MENIKYLKTLLNIILIMGIAGIVTIPIVLAFSNDIKINGIEMKEWNAFYISKTIINAIIYILFLIRIYKLREAIENFYLHQLFNDIISKCFKQIGYLIIIGTCSYIILNWLAESIFTSGIGFHLNLDYLIHAAIALFFFTLSTMIDKAKGIQQENDLTV